MTTEERKELYEDLTEYVNEQNKMLQTLATGLFQTQFSKIEIPKLKIPTEILQASNMMLPTIELPKLIFPEIDLFHFRLPEFNFPKIEFPKLELDFERIEKTIDHNSKYGWTLTREMDFYSYTNEDLLNLTQIQKDKHFYCYYSKDDWKHYHYMKDSLLESIDPKWSELLGDCLECFEQDKYKLIIPTLFSIIEGESALIYKSDEVGSSLIKFMKAEATSERNKLTQIAIYSLTKCMKKQLFLYHQFHQNRGSIINRNWVLHGRDDPRHWEKVDALRLINVLSTLQLVKEYKRS